MKKFRGQAKRMVNGTFLGAGLILSCATQPAHAVPPTKVESPFTAPFTIDWICAFPVTFSPVGTNPASNNQKLITFYNKQGQPTLQAMNGSLTVKATNANTGKSVYLNASGPAKFTPQPDGTTLWTTTGPWVWYFPPPPQGKTFPLPLFSYVNGRMESIFDASGNFSGLKSIVGTVEDACTLLE
ncbi:hypothetical protein [Methylocystis parvus]|uniref:hypothetical protein n=1 Tax=Methylocystis parvus TaxID=134 RepID=UPI003C72731D